MQVVAAAAEAGVGQQEEAGEEEAGRIAAGGAAGGAVAEENEQGEEDEEAGPVWEAGRDPLPPTLSVALTCGDVVEEGAEGFDVLLLVSAAFTDSLLRTMAAALDPLPVGTLVRT